MNYNDRLTFEMRTYVTCDTEPIAMMLKAVNLRTASLFSSVLCFVVLGLFSADVLATQRISFETSALSTHEQTIASGNVADEKAEQKAIAELLQKQVDCWNRFDIDGFMETYWNSPELTFSSGGETTRGWQSTLDRYKRRYSTKEKMGHLAFDDLEITMLSDTAALVLGKWKLTRDEDTPQGNFSLVLRKTDEGWRIIHDHSSAIETE